MTESGPDQNHSLLTPGRNCWRVEQAGRFAVLMENAAYFEALRSAFAKARRSIVILGWQFDPRTRLDPHSAHDDHLAQIGHQLRMLVKARPELDVRLLIWKSPLLIAASQGFYPHRARVWFRKRLVEFRLDPPPAIGACHHQKVIVIDDSVAFCGGGDISTDRWDSEQHLDDDPRRCQPSGLIPSPRHEVMAVMDGAAARALGDLARERWFRATGERTIADEADNDAWPDGVEPDLRQTPVAIVRTEPAAGGRAEVRENEVLHLDAIRRAKRLIYMENQYFTSPVIAEALAARLGEIDGPEVVLVSTGTSPSWFDRITMDTARSEVLYRLEGLRRRRSRHRNRRGGDPSVRHRPDAHARSRAAVANRAHHRRVPAGRPDLAAGRLPSLEATHPLSPDPAGPYGALISKSMISGRWSEAIRARGEKDAFTAVTRTSGLVKQ